MDEKELQKALREKTITPEQALEEFEVKSAHIRDVAIFEEPESLESGLKSFDTRKILKKGRGELVIIGARPGMGKSALMFQIASYVATKGTALIFSLEMDKELIKTRLIAQEARAPIKKLTEGRWDEKIKRAITDINSRALHIDDRGGVSISTILTAARDFHKRRPLDLVVVDYLGLIRSRDLGNRVQEIGDVTMGLKELSKELKCPVLVGSQLNRQCEQRGRSDGDYRPNLGDLRDSGNIEQDADVVVFISRQEIYDGERPGTADIRIAKHRNGSIGDFTVGYSSEITRFYDKDGGSDV